MHSHFEKQLLEAAIETENMWDKGNIPRRTNHQLFRVIII